LTTNNTIDSLSQPNHSHVGSRATDALAVRWLPVGGMLDDVP